MHSEADSDMDSTATGRASGEVPGQPPAEPLSAAIAATAPGQLRVIKRNGTVVHYTDDKIALALTKAFLAVEGGTAAASPRIRELVAHLTEQITGTFKRRFPSGGTLHIEDIQDQVELALMRSGEHRVAKARAPYASDRCTVFMQRDISHLLGAGHDVPEVLASVLHSVRDNYLQRVAREASIGAQVCFQGATAKNPALVAAFEQRLGRPIAVSRYCHLTGALGAALLLAEQPGERSERFRGLGLARATIQTDHERCDLCRNQCVITTARIGESVS